MLVIEQQLNDLAELRAAHALTITYSDMHGLWGGSTVTLLTSGAYERLERTRGMRLPDALRKTVTPAHIQEIIRLLLDMRAWEQQTPEQMMLPDESRATLTLRAGDVAVSIWERSNDLEQNDRLVRVRRLLFALANE